MGGELGGVDEVDLLGLLGLGAALTEVGLVGAARVAMGPDEAESPFAEERALVARAVPERRRELAAGRRAARAAMAELGRAPEPIGRRPDRSPAWPAGLVGSITHTDGLVAAAVATRPGLGGPGRVGLGLDAEVDRPLPPGVAGRVVGADERTALGATATADGVVVFSAKEAVFKALNPMTGRWLEPGDVSVELVADDAARPARRSGSFAARLGPGGPDDPSVVRGRWVRRGRWVLTACVVTAAGSMSG